MTEAPQGIYPALRDAILAWYDALGRTLPFRGVSDPYLILVSEVMAQQTQIARVGVAWREFTIIFPTVESLAAATPADVLRAWRGLGYNRRALNLWRAANVIVDEHDGRVPAGIDALERLPGIGPYTARAVAAIAFGARVGAVDTNVRRVFGRAMAGAPDAIPAAALQRLADASVPGDRAADWTHALMDVGSTFCRTSRPACEGCPARPWCRYAAAGVSATIPAAVSGPIRERKRAVPFASSTRWLRGRILDRLRQVEGSSWLEIGAPIGEHDRAAVVGSIELLAAEGLVERDPTSELKARLPLA